MSSALDGHWVTVNGEHVFISGGVITKGPANVIGKKPAKLEQPGGIHRSLAHKVSGSALSYHAAVAQEKAKNADLVSVAGKPGGLRFAGGEKIPRPRISPSSRF